MARKDWRTVFNVDSILFRGSGNFYPLPKLVFLPASARYSGITSSDSIEIFDTRNGGRYGIKSVLDTGDDIRLELDGTPQIPYPGDPSGDKNVVVYQGSLGDLSTIRVISAPTSVPVTLPGGGSISMDVISPYGPTNCIELKARVTTSNAHAVSTLSKEDERIPASIRVTWDALVPDVYRFRWHAISIYGVVGSNRDESGDKQNSPGYLDNAYVIRFDKDSNGVSGQPAGNIRLFKGGHPGSGGDGSIRTSLPVRTFTDNNGDPVEVNGVPFVDPADSGTVSPTWRRYRFTSLQTPSGNDLVFEVHDPTTGLFYPFINERDHHLDRPTNTVPGNPLTYVPKFAFNSAWFTPSGSGQGVVFVDNVQVESIQ